MSRILEGLNILVVEDEFLIALEVEQLCLDYGAANVTIARNLAETVFDVDAATGAPDKSRLLAICSQRTGCAIANPGRLHRLVGVWDLQVEGLSDEGRYRDDRLSPDKRRLLVALLHA